MQSRTFEKTIWVSCLILCALMLLAQPADASVTGKVIGLGFNPFIYAVGLVVTYIGSKLLGSSRGHF